MDAVEWVRHEFESSWRDRSIQLHVEDLLNCAEDCIYLNPIDS